jgi:ABC-type nitrate/sulfonate/bicarbonate transport system permease component
MKVLKITLQVLLMKSSNTTLSAKNRNPKRMQNLGRADGATLMHSLRRIRIPKEFSTLRVGFRLPMQIQKW